MYTRNLKSQATLKCQIMLVLLIRFYIAFEDRAYADLFSSVHCNLGRSHLQAGSPLSLTRKLPTVQERKETELQEMSRYREMHRVQNWHGQATDGLALGTISGRCPLEKLCTPALARETGCHCQS